MNQEFAAEPRSKFPRYFDVMRRHKFLLVLPVIVALAVSVPLALMKPHKYVASTTVWFDTSVPNASSLEAGQPYAGQLPSAAGQSVFQELIATRQFLVAVGHTGPLASNLAAKGVAPGAIDDKIVGTLGTAFGLAPVGPQILQITMTGTDPSIIDGTLTALVQQYSDQVTNAQNSRDKAQIEYFKSQLNAKQTTLTQASNEVTAYLDLHPGATVANDAVLQAKVGVQASAQADWTNTQASYNQAQLASKNVGSDSAFHTIDKPLAPLAQGRMKKVLFTGVAGVFGGLFVAALVLAGLAAADRTARRPEDIEDSLGLEVVGVISEFPQSEPDTPRARRTRSS